MGFARGGGKGRATYLVVKGSEGGDEEALEDVLIVPVDRHGEVGAGWVVSEEGRKTVERNGYREEYGDELWVGV